MTAVVSRPGGVGAASPVGRGPARRRRHRLADRPWSLWLALSYVAVLAVAALAPGFLAPSSPTAVDYAAALLPPSLEHPFGTDESGRDLYTRIVHGAADSLSIGLGAAALAIVCAIALGALAALGPRPIAALVDRVIEVLFAFPTLLLALLLIAITGPSATTQIIAVGLGSAPGYARMVRGQIRQAAGSGYVEAAVALGHGRARILRRHVLPNALRPLVAVAALAVGQSIVWASSLSFLGLGVAPPSPEWGALLDAGRPYVIQAGWLIVIPGLVIVALALAATSIGRHLQHRLESGARA
ncbi:ABC transporter permease [Microcella alkalica]|uniref:Peptide/nickel transport system permease protein n=1 Tax=Microcella alkalica TaxID=355930 RepID=A0A839EDY9_9MICO|nr:ABC transporter permease [Microcella alkalica]MBA8848464.1 peptide/nickel transport system permease protein [Microcella alkalica]